PIPELIDNAGDENLRVSFNLTDPKNKTVVSFDNIYATDAENAGYVEGSEAFGTVGTKYYFFRYWENSAYSVDPATGAITGTGISGTAKSLVYYDATAGKLTKGFFSFDDYKATSKAGSYTATYRARDDEGNASSRTYNVNYKATFEDLTVPTVSLDTPDYFAFRDYETTQSITNVVISDSNDARLDVQYYVVFNQNAGLVNTLDYAASFDAVMANADDAVELPVSGSNVLTFEKEGSDYNVTVNDVNGDEIVTTVDASKPIYVVAKATDSAGNSDAYAKEVKIVDGTATVTDSFAPAFANVNNANGTVGSEYVFGSFVIDYKTAENRDYVGFELYVQRVQDANGVDVDESPLSDVSFETYRNPATDANKYVHVDNIRFTPTKTGKYMVVARGFHVSGASSVQISYVDVTGSATGSKPVSAVIGANLNFGQTYTLPNDYTVPETWGNSGVLRSITGGRFTMMGTEFTALQSTTYKFNDYVFEYSAGAASNLVNYDDSFGIAGNNIAVGQQISSASDKASATFRVIGDAMPTYAELGAIVKLPNVTASSSNGSASKITCKVTDPDGQDVTVYNKDSKVFPEGYTGSAPVGHEFLFEAEYDGEYLITYTAILNNKSTTASYTIKVGDVVAPDFTVDKGYVNGTLVGSAATVEASVNDKFDFAAIKLQGDDASATGLTYSKTITNPEGEVLATVTKRDSKNDGTSYELTTAGRYVIEYKVTDEAGNFSKLTYSINVTSTSGSISSDSITTLVVVIIVVCVLAVAVAIIFFVRFRKRRA
ncbi:MAG: hypothetical protein IJX05_00005, partial [Clostridia bacterium]|nr:hypothetical protein [Clostridia bacterium]